MTTVVDSSIKTPIILPIGVAYRFTDRIIKNNNEEVKIESAKFYMRPYLSRIPSINGATGEVIGDELGDNVAVKLTAEELAFEGEYFAWWSFKSGGEEFQTPEFPVVVTDHGPGTGVETGAIVDGVSDHMPTTVDALKKSPNFGERRIQKIATLIQIRVLKSYVQPDEELTAYELPLLDYFSKRVALELCRPGIDYWARQLRTATKVGPTEISSYPDMIQSLEKLRDHLVIELEENWRELSFLVPELKQRKAVPMPASSLEFHETPEQNGTLRRRIEPVRFLTKNPNEWQRLATGWRGNYDLFSPLGFWPSFP
jgi:hypothetical protein